ncbi:MAG: coenzyme F430 synthase [Methanocorpusculum sp.]|nr:coenzyme F430 synthase [Methanocorpusculum sp.]
MRVLVLDTIHGGATLAEALLRRGDDVDAIDVYRGGTLTPEEAVKRKYDCITAPIHLDPDYSLLHTETKIVSHHEMTKDLIGDFSKPIIEITGSRGKTTTAFAVASLFDTKSILHTSRGTFLMPEGKLLFKKSITPASLLFAVKAAETYGAQRIIAEESVGVTGVGELGILTSTDDYKIAAGKKSALEAKLKSLEPCQKVLVPKGISKKPGWETIDDIISVNGNKLTYSGGSFENPLLSIPLYCDVIKTAAAAAVILGISPEKLAGFSAIEGRMNLFEEDGVTVMDNSNSGTTAQGCIEAAKFLRKNSDKKIILAIGQEFHAVCEGFSEEEIQKAVYEIAPAKVIRAEKSFDEVRDEALRLAKENDGCVLLGVKTWR